MEQDKVNNGAESQRCNVVQDEFNPSSSSMSLPASQERAYTDLNQTHHDDSNSQAFLDNEDELFRKAEEAAMLMEAEHKANEAKEKAAIQEANLMALKETQALEEAKIRALKQAQQEAESIRASEKAAAAAAALQAEAKENEKALLQRGRGEDLNKTSTESNYGSDITRASASVSNGTDSQQEQVIKQFSLPY